MTTERDRGLDETHADRADAGQLLAVLANEHASLNATRSMAWGDSSSRIGSFLSALGAGSVAIALVGGATRFDPASFLPFTVLVLAVLLILGVTAYLRLVQINIEDATLVGAMNRIRAGYLDLAPGAARYLSTDAHDDAAGTLRSLTLGLGGPVGGSQVIQALVTAPATVGIITAVIGGLLAGSVVLWVGGVPAVALVIGGLAAVVLFLLLAGAMARAWVRLERAVVPRFPSGPDEPAA